MMNNQLTQFLAQEESSGGTDPRARIIDNAGTGKYQLSRDLYTDIQEHFPEYKNIPYERAALEDGLDRQVAYLGQQVIQRQFVEHGLVATPALIATAWQQGTQNVMDAIADAKGKHITTKLPKLGKRRFTRASAALTNPLAGALTNSVAATKSKIDRYKSKEATEERKLFGITETQQRAMGGF